LYIPEIIYHGPNQGRLRVIIRSVVTSNFHFYTKPEYYAGLIEFLNAAQAGDRFMTANMITAPWQPEVAEVLAAMIGAAKRGAHVSLITDARVFMIDDDQRLMPGPLLFHRRLPRHGLDTRFQLVRDQFEELKSAGGRYVLLNRPTHLLANPDAGRNHIKFTVMNDRYFIGGCNFESYHNLDMMVGADDPRVCGWLRGMGERMIETTRSLPAIGPNDLEFAGPPGATFFVDAGAPHRSIILRQAINLIDAAREHVTLTCQFFPGGITARRLAVAHKRGVRVKIYFNSPTLNRSILFFGFAGAQLLERLQNPPEFFRHELHGPGYLHTKLLATEQGAMVGSHNFVSHGVSLGTAELALRVMDPEFARQAIATVRRQLPAASR
jgi:phosphatidylserine/phosphatidylglycerophosphate/cardiolipin synthase-like enzyme